MLKPYKQHLDMLHAQMLMLVMKTNSTQQCPHIMAANRLENGFK